jgi:MFS family permease
VGRFGLGRLAVASLLVAAAATALIPLSPAGMPLVAVAFFLVQQLVGDSAITMFDVTEVSIRQARVGDRELGRVNATVRVMSVLAQLGGTVVAGIVGEVLGIRAAAVLAPAFVLLGALALYRSPVRREGRFARSS